MKLTRRQLEVARELAAGYQSKEIAKLLRVSYRTVEMHTLAIYRKLGVTTRGQCITELQRQGFIIVTPEGIV